MNQGLKILLEGQGFRHVNPKSCEFTRKHESSEIRVYLFRVWLHRNGGQAEVLDFGTGKRLARMPLWIQWMT